ncbi:MULTISPECIES: 2-C-methyl-D-erythritol 2,4-cyclodiphosphate synthase [Gammaproteobacteria]|uniref:2-C-methyl-D-erythritol 2,4-cyclodiphosphate synthase n=1 Tax=Gammaproteobacteria TaxID=1236 RepID=UPI000DCFDD6D|nr:MULTISPECIES: 2-C-methyl-D-erythritol 2,4-cyclodiphosphate synthase [Gammaproteobacteria]RTE87120.1 2-C-methyl-D-erythritol 2,4-cyclodiphosphate synthase [Aliidiomarina sp. B3213]TCZ93092.1 2-C-methyl-D-erythritol 2,4-cyclodiphosphate synthase [Lysobacter sp. N42]
MRIGQGFDVHKFGGEGPVTLLGVKVPSEQGLLAHSDGDVGLHALADAFLGAIGEGDIGVWFPDNDPQYKGADSSVLLQAVFKRVLDLGYNVGNLDVTLICEAPKVNPYREAMKNRIAEILGISTSLVNVKATTTEKLGFTGRKEGIAAMATVLLVGQS